ncbi:MAG: M15 family metallopeptidase [Aestuariivirga sp.]
MRYAGHPVASVKIHRKCAASLTRVFSAIWVASGKSQAKIDEWGVSTFGGSYNFRLMRNSSHLSMHSYGCAIDLAPERFPLGSHAHTFAPEVIKAFNDEGWQNLPNDRMHFQAALVPGMPIQGRKPVPLAPRPAKPQTAPQRAPSLAVASIKPKPAPQGLLGATTMQILPSTSNLNLGSISLLIGGLGALLPTIIAEGTTVGLVAAGAVALGAVIQIFIPPATVAKIETTFADTIIPIAENFDPALKPFLEQFARGLRDAALDATNKAAAANQAAGAAAQAAGQPAVPLKATV